MKEKIQEGIFLKQH